MIDKFHEYLRYKGGRLYWKKGKRGSYGQDKEVGGSISIHGYRRMMFEGKEYNVSRVIFYLHYGYWPQYVDHINGNKLDDRIENLREANASQNQANVGPQKNNTIGFKGVVLYRGKYVGKIMHQGKRYYLGQYDTAQEAAIAYDNKAKELYGEYSRLNIREDTS